GGSRWPVATSALPEVAGTSATTPTPSTRMWRSECAQSTGSVRIRARSKPPGSAIPWRFMTQAWTAPQVERIEPGLILGERQALEAWLDFHRDTLLLKCAGLSAGQVKERAVPPSRLSLLGLVRHMTEVERWWFRIHAANTDLLFPYDPDQTGQDFEAVDDANAAANIEAFKREVEHARAAVAGKQLDDV